MESSSSNLASEVETAEILRAESPPNAVRPVSVFSYPRPLWLSSTGYFLIALIASISLFFVVWGLLHDQGENEMPWIPAGIAASLTMSMAIAAREIILRRAQTRYLLLHDKSISSVTPPPRLKPQVKNKFTLEQNAAALKAIQSKVDAANSILATSENHLEVFKASQEYLELVEKELQNVQTGSPRLPALRNGLENVRIIHKHHLLRWAAEKSHRLMREASVLVLVNEKVEIARRAIETLDFAIKFYPNEAQLLESSAAVREFIILARVTHWTELAERSVFKKQFRRAVDYYQDALFYLSREAISSVESELMTTKIENEIARLTLKLSNKKAVRKKLTNKKIVRKRNY